MESPNLHTHWIGLYAQSNQLELLQFSSEGTVLARRRSPALAADFDAIALAHWVNTETQDWLSAHPHSAIIAAGIEPWLNPAQAMSLTLPVDVDALANAVPCAWSGHAQLYLLPSLKQAGVLPDHLSSHAVARILGVMAGSQLDEVMLGLLAERHHWLRVQTQQLRRSHCFITPRLKSLLFTPASNAEEDDQDWHSGAFDFGLALARGEDRQAGVLASLASPQPLVASGQLAPHEVGSFKHGLLIGHELLGLMRVEPDSAPACPIVLLGDENRCLRYARALQLLGYEYVERATDALERGLWHVAQKMVTGGSTVLPS